MDAPKYYKRDLVEDVYRKARADPRIHADITKTAADELVTHVLESMTQALADGRSLCLMNYLTSSSHVVPEHSGHSPLDGRPLEFPERRIVRLRAGKRFRDAVAGA